jgi:hypothetical protein
MLINFKTLETLFPGISRRLIEKGRQATISTDGKIGFILSERELEDYKEKLDELFRTEESLMLGRQIDNIYILKGEGIYLIEVQAIEI